MDRIKTAREREKLMPEGDRLLAHFNRVAKGDIKSVEKALNTRGELRLGVGARENLMESPRGGVKIRAVHMVLSPSQEQGVLEFALLLAPGLVTTNQPVVVAGASG